MTMAKPILSPKKTLKGEKKQFGKAAHELRANGPTREYFQRLKDAASGGQVEAMTDLGLWLLEGSTDLGGEVLRRSPRRAVKLLRRAAEEKSSMAMLALGNCYADGIGITKDLIAAERLFRAAARARENFAAFNFLPHSTGTGVPILRSGTG